MPVSVNARQYTVAATGDDFTGLAYVVAFYPLQAEQRFLRAMPACRVAAVFDGEVAPCSPDTRTMRL